MGKTEFARALVRSVNASGFEIKSMHRNHQMLSPCERRDNFSLACELVPSDHKTVLIFDDADESLISSESSTKRASTSKAAINQMLECNVVPTIWILNEIHELDPAVVRRFDIAIPFRRPPSANMRRQLESALPSQAVSNDWIQKVSASKGLTPAVVTRLARISQRLEFGACKESMLDTSLKASCIEVSMTDAPNFNREFCNTDPGIANICMFLEKSATSRLLLHGPTGTGKTALARHLAEAVGLYPMLISPSDILGSFVGETERNIAHLFKQTDSSEHLIILDEFESLAADRRGARHSWEVSKVAEMLNRFDQYQGRVIACTNLIDNVDSAIKRRFHLKAKVDSLSIDQRVELLHKFASQLNIDPPQDPSAFVSGLDGLAYGHLKNATEVATYMNDIDWPQYLALVRSELVGTEGSVSKSIGFVS